MRRNPWKMPRPSVEWLRQKYLIEGLDCVEMSALVGCDSKTMWLWVTTAGIPTRSRGFGHPANFYKPGALSAFSGRTHSPESRAKIDKATRARGGVPYLRNGTHWLKTPGAVNGRWKGGITPERQTFYRSDEWKAAATLVWKRDAFTCQRCLLQANTVRKTVPFALHHIDSFQIRERRAAPDNLILLCRPCHFWIHSKANVDRMLLGAGHDPNPVPFWFAEHRKVANA